MISQSVPVKQVKQKPIPILIKASLKNHSPDEIYDFLFRNVGKPGIKIKKKQALIGFEQQKYFDKVIREFKVVNLHGKKLEFSSIPMAEQNFLQEEEQQVVDIEKKQDILNSKYAIPEFKAKNHLQSKANRYRFDMHVKVQEQFTNTVISARQRLEQLKLEIKEQGPRQREIKSLEALIENKLKAIESKYETDINKLNKSIIQFSMKANNIDVEPTFAFEENWQFPRITERNMKFEEAAFFKNSNQFPCKRLCAINGNQFAVTMYNSKNPQGPQGRVRLYDVNCSDFKKSINIDPGAYGICRIKNYMIMGASDSTLRYLDLEDSQLTLNSTRKLLDTPHGNFFDIKVLKHSEEKPEILTISGDNNLRKYQISIDDMGHGLKDLSFEEKQLINAQNCCTFDIISPVIILYGFHLSLRKYHLEKKIVKDIRVGGKPLKIKKFNQNLFAVSTSSSLELVDMRTQTVVQRFFHMPKQLISLEVIGDHSIMYGGLCEIGMVDDRKENILPWKSEAHHKDVVYDILKLKNIVISCDKKGLIYGWKLAAQRPMEPIVVELC